MTRGTSESSPSASAGVCARRDQGYISVVAATAYAYPSTSVSNEEYVRRAKFEPKGGWAEIARSSRMKSRKWCDPSENTRTLAEHAVAKLAATHPDLMGQVDVVVVASGTTMTMAHPSDPNNASFADLAPLLLRQLGLDRALGLDIKACYCSGFIRGVQVMDALLANPNYRAGLLVAVEQGSRFATSSHNRTAFCYIVGDAAGAVLFRREEARTRAGVLDYCGYTEVSKLDWVGIGADASSIIMMGSRAAQRTVEMLLECGRTLLQRNGLSSSDVDWLLPIQSHADIVEGLASELQFPREKLLWFGDVNGFSGSASIPACLAEQCEAGAVRPGQLVLSLAVGAGMNCGGALYYA